MAEAERPDEILARLGSDADSDQNLRLNFGEDPIFAHLATLATATALCGVTWDLRGKEDKPKLHATRVINGKRPNSHLNIHARDELEGFYSLKDGVKIKGNVKIYDFRTGHSIFGGEKGIAIRKSLSRTPFMEPGGANKTVEKSTVWLERDSDVQGVRPFKVGLMATHAAYTENSLEVATINEGTRPDVFRDLFGLIKEMTERDDDESSFYRGSNVLSRLRTENITSNPYKHFSFYEKLGVPLEAVDRGRNNFNVLTKALTLPFELNMSQDDTSSES